MRRPLFYDNRPLISEQTAPKKHSRPTFLHSKMHRFAMQYEPYRSTKRAVLHCKTARFAAGDAANRCTLCRLSKLSMWISAHCNCTLILAVFAAQLSFRRENASHGRLLQHSSTTNFVVVSRSLRVVGLYPTEPKPRTATSIRAKTVKRVYQTVMRVLPRHSKMITFA